MLNKIESKKLKPQIQEQIWRYIRGFKLKEGEPLPSENYFAQQLGLSRASIREALNSLESIGVVEVRHGVGWFLKRFNFSAILGNIKYNVAIDLESFKDLLEIRICLESSFLLRNLYSFSSKNLQALRQILRKMETLIHSNSDETELITEHASFHCTVLSTKIQEINY